MDVNCLINLVEFDPPVNGGQALIAQELCRLLASYAGTGNQRIAFAVNVYNCRKFEEWLGETQAYIIPVIPGNGLSPLLSSIHPRLLISPLLGMPPFDRTVYPDIPHLVMIPDTLVLDRPHLLPPDEVERRLVIYRQLHDATVIVAYSQQARQSLIDYLALSPDQVVVVPLAGDFLPETPESLTSPIEQPFVFYPANGWPHKRHEFLLQIMLEVWKTQPQWKVVLAGWHPPNFISDLVAQYGCPPDRVIHLGYIPRAALKDYYSWAAALLFVSCYEGFGMPLLEAMEFGCPVICGRYGAMPEVAGDAALIVNSEDPAQWAHILLNELPGVRSDLIAKGHLRAGLFTWGRFRSNWERILDEVGLYKPDTSEVKDEQQPLTENMLNEELGFWAINYSQQQQALVDKERVIQGLIQELQSQNAVASSFRKNLEDANASLQLLERERQDINGLTQELLAKENVIQAMAQQIEDQDARVSKLERERQDSNRQAQELLAKENVIQAMAQQMEDKEAVITLLAREVQRLRRRESVAKSIKSVLKRVLVPAAKAIPFIANGVRHYKNLSRPKLGQFNQYAPIPLNVPPRYRVMPHARGRLPSISIVTPSYNTADFLEKTITSVLGQNYNNLEYIVQDGGSKDGTDRILAQYDSRLTYSESVPDHGQADAINRGFVHSSGEIMGYLNADDLLLPGTLHFVGNYFATHPEVDVAYGHRIIIDADDYEIGRWVLPPHDTASLLWADYIPQETMFWRRRIWEKAGSQVDESFQFALDWELLLRFQSIGARFVRLPRFLGAFRVHKQQKTSSWLVDVGQREMFQLRERYLGRAVQQAEVDKQIRPYLRRHSMYHTLYRLKLMRY